MTEDQAVSQTAEEETGCECECGPECDPDNRDSRNDVADFAESLQDLVNTASGKLTILELVGALELVKAEALMINRENRMFEEVNSALAGEA